MQTCYTEQHGSWDPIAPFYPKYTQVEKLSGWCDHNHKKPNQSSSTWTAISVSLLSMMGNHEIDERKNCRNYSSPRSKLLLSFDAWLCVNVLFLFGSGAEREKHVMAHGTTSHQNDLHLYNGFIGLSRGTHKHVHRDIHKHKRIISPFEEISLSWHFTIRKADFRPNAFLLGAIPQHPYPVWWKFMAQGAMKRANAQKLPFITTLKIQNSSCNLWVQSTEPFNAIAKGMRILSDQKYCLII